MFAALGLAAVSVAPAAAVASSDESVAYQVTPGHTGFASGGSLDRPPLDVRWTRTLGVDAPYANPPATTSYPLVAGGRVFVIAYDAAHAGGILFALDGQTGTTLWSRDVDGSGQIAYDGGRIFVSERAGTVVAVAADTGATEWARALPQPFQLQSPVAAGGIVYVDTAWDGGGLYALNASDGSTKWFSSDYNEGNPALAGGLAYVSDDYEGATLAVSLNDGTPVWTGTSTCFVGSGHVVADGARIIGPWNSGCGSLVDGATGGVLDSIASSASPAVAGDVAVLLDGSTLQGRSLSTGLLRWQFAGDGTLSSAPVIVNGTVYEGSASGAVFAVDLQTGTEVWSGSVAAPGTVAGSAGMAAGDGLLVVPAGGTITAFASAAPTRAGLDLAISSGPEGPSTSDAATFSFGSGDPSVPERCRLDGAAWTPCLGDATYASLPMGPHMFEVETVDQTDASTIGLAVRGWSVQAVLPSSGAGGVTTPISPSPAATVAPTVSAPSVPGAVIPVAAQDASTTSSRDTALASTTLARLADTTLARTLADAGATLLRGKTRAQLRARPAMRLYSRGAERISIAITYSANRRSFTLATASAVFTGTGTRDVRLALTRPGQTVLARRGKLSVVVRATVSPVVGSPITAKVSARV